MLRDRWDVLLVISAGGVLGSLARWGVALALPRSPAEFPWATALVNVVGCLLIGVLMVLVLEVWPPSRYARPFLGTGVLGGFTTFSTAMLDLRGLLAAGEPMLALAYLGGSLLVGLAAVELGAGLARALIQRGRPGADRRTTDNVTHGGDRRTTGADRTTPGADSTTGADSTPTGDPRRPA